MGKQWKQCQTLFFGCPKSLQIVIAAMKLKDSEKKKEAHGFQSNHFLQIHGKTMEKLTDFIFLGSKITIDGDCSHEMKRCLLFGRKVMTNLDSILKSRDITLPTKVRLVKAMVFPIVMYGCEES